MLSGQKTGQKILHNISNIQQDDIAMIFGVFSFGLVLYLGLMFSDIEQTKGNMGQIIAYSQIISHWLLAILFGLFVSATVYKVRRSKQRDTKQTGGGIIGGLVSAIIIGCPACSISIASYLGLGALLVNMPGFGLEIKLLGLVVLIRATRTTLRDLSVCKIKK